MICCTCGNEMSETTTTYFEELKNTIVIIKNVPCHKCEKCGEILFNGLVVERLEKIIDSFKESISEISIVNYSVA